MFTRSALQEWQVGVVDKAGDITPRGVGQSGQDTAGFLGATQCLHIAAGGAWHQSSLGAKRGDAAVHMAEFIAAKLRLPAQNANYHSFIIA